jgi:hypothetical protein
VSKGSTVGDVYRKVMGDAPMAYVETEGGRRVAEDDIVVKGKNDVSCSHCRAEILYTNMSIDPEFQGWKSIVCFYFNLPNWEGVLVGVDCGGYLPTHSPPYRANRL